MPTTLQARERSVHTPFQIDETGGVRYVTSADQLASQEIQAVLLTALGERVMRPGIGSPFSTQVFANITSDDEAYAANEILDVLVRSCRYSTIHNIAVDTSQLGVFSISVQYIPNSFNVVLSVDIPFSTVKTTLG